MRSIKLLISNIEIKTITNICYILRFNKNILSISQMNNFKNLVLFINSIYLLLILQKPYKTKIIGSRNPRCRLCKLLFFIKSFEVYNIEASFFPKNKSPMNCFIRFKDHLKILSEPLVYMPIKEPLHK